ncbi:hypothetical protein GW17_00031444, partial [Ensete ventricosum]
MKGLEACQEFVRSLLGARQELAEGNRELVRMASGAHQKKTKRLTRRSSGVSEKLTGMCNGCTALVDICTALVYDCTTTTQFFEQLAVVVPPMTTI